MPEVPEQRVTAFNQRPVRGEGQFVLYWMSAFRRPGYNFALQHAAEWAQRLQRPLLILEILFCDYDWASDRLHRFLLDGMADNRKAFAAGPARYYPFVESQKGEGEELLAALAQAACLVVADDFPAYGVPQRLQAAAGKVEVLLEAVDANGVLPIKAADRPYPSAYAFRRFLQQQLRGHLLDFPKKNPLARRKLPPHSGLPQPVRRRWPEASAALLRGEPAALARLPIDHNVAPTGEGGGWVTARRYLQRFLAECLPLYAERHNDPQERVTSELSPYLHCGHISAHEIVAGVLQQEGWQIDRLSIEARGKRRGWWGVGEGAEAFLDQLITWRELGFNACAFLPDHDRYSSLPEWARQTLEAHHGDVRPYRYTLEEFERAQTHDPLWNAAQTQLLREGRLHNYLRMLWGKKILEWSPDAKAALRVMFALNDRYALDGRDPNSCSGIFWCLGRYDRAWGPERPLFGKIRYMSSENTARKYQVKGYLEKYAPCDQQRSNTFSAKS